MSIGQVVVVVEVECQVVVVNRVVLEVDAFEVDVFEVEDAEVLDDEAQGTRRLGKARAEPSVAGLGLGRILHLGETCSEKSKDTRLAWKSVE